jgi:hypothetical protein
VRDWLSARLTTPFSEMQATSAARAGIVPFEKGVAMGSAGRYLSRSAQSQAHRGSRKRLRRLKWYKHTPIEVWIAFIMMALVVFGLVPWMWHHSTHILAHR